MKIKTTQTVEHEVEISLPYFFKDTVTETHFAVLLETLSVNISDREVKYYPYHEPVSQFIPLNSTRVEITAEEFTRMFDKRIGELQALKSHFFKP